jgi:hypothetical protein
VDGNRRGLTQSDSRIKSNNLQGKSRISKG